ncbi:MAG TPA: M23 family metallopeptidase [Chlorobaculum sp.]|nr:M23 family metallopeptidase [Chlorobaculum sp.]
MPFSKKDCSLEKGNTIVKERNAGFSRLIAFAVALMFVILQPVSGAVTGMNTAYASDAAQASVSPAQASREELLSTTEQMIEQLIIQINQQDENILDQEGLQVKSGKSSLVSRPNIRPITGMISSDFGMREHPILKRVLFHAGTDFSAPVGTKVIVTADGTVAFSGFDRGFGKTVIINHANGYQTVYAHLSKTVIRQGQHVNRGDVIAFSGNTGLSTGPHLHYEVHKDNVQVNPIGYFPNDIAKPHHVSRQESTRTEEHSHS